MFRKFFTRNIKSGARIRKTALLFRCGQSAGRPFAINLTMNCIARKDSQDENWFSGEYLRPQTGTTKWRLSRRCLEGRLVRPLRVRRKSPVSKRLAVGNCWANRVSIKQHG